MYFQVKDYSPVPAGTKVAFIGLGTMGFPMAGHLLHAGCQVTVYNRTASKAEAWVEKFGGKSAPTPREAAQDADVVFTCVGNDNDLRSVLLGENGAFAGMKKDAVLWDATTDSAEGRTLKSSRKASTSDSAEVAKEMAAQAESLGLHFVDAPVSGGQDGAVSGSLTVMCGGDAEIIERVKPIADAFACSIRRIGPVGSGQLAKMCNQICIAGVVQGLAEAIAFGQTAGINMHTVLDVIGKGAASSWQMHRRGDTMIEGKFDFGFAVDWMRKDLGICLEQARKTGADLPLTALVDQFYGEVQNMGGGRFDTSSLILRLNREPKKS